MPKGYMAIVKLLLAHDAWPDFAPPSGKTLLMLAAMFNRLEIVQCLQPLCVAIDTRCPEGLTALDLAPRMNATETIAYFELGGDRR